MLFYGMVWCVTYSFDLILCYDVYLLAYMVCYVVSMVWCVYAIICYVVYRLTYMIRYDGPMLRYGCDIA